MSISTVQSPSASVQVGDFFVSSWGYDQTNIDFYKVVGVTPSGKSVKVQQWKSKVEGEVGGPQETVVPGDGPRTYIDWSGVDRTADYWTQQEQKIEKGAPVETRRIKTWGSTVAFTVNSFSSAHKWDGRRQSQTGTGWGH